MPIPATNTAGIDLLVAEHAGAMQRLLSDASIAALFGASSPPHPTAGADAIALATEQRLAGTAYWFAVIDRKEPKGVCGVTSPYADSAEVYVYIVPAARRGGYGTFALRMVLEFAFRNLQRERVVAPAPDAAAATLLHDAGFVELGSPDPPNAAPTHAITRAEYLANRDRPALAALHPDLRAILDAEIAAGNEVAETGGGWPDPDSVFVRLRDPFRTKPILPVGVVYTEPNDPHWWKADYTTRKPRHVLAC